MPADVHPDVPRFTGDRLVVAVPVTEGGASLGTVYLRSFTEPFALRLQRYGVIGLLMTMASVVVAVLGVMQLTQRRANEELARRAEQLAAANQALETQIEQREKVEEALRQSQKMEAIGQLTGGVAHDFNNLLQVILGNLERLGRPPARQRAGGGSGERRLIEAATRAAGRAATLTQRLLAFSRRQPLAPKALDLNRLVAGLLDLLGRTLGETIHVETVLAGGLWRVFADENQLENALLNLAVNARDAMPEGGRLTLETQNVRLDEAYARIARGRAGRRLCAGVGERYRCRHDQGGAGAGVRSVLHHEGYRPGHRAWACRRSMASSGSPAAMCGSTARRGRARA